MEHFNRKSARIPGYDYATENYYFITICTYEKKCIFGQAGNLNGRGKIAEELLRQIPEHFPGVKIDKAVVMPNHIHAVIILGCGNGEGDLPSLNAVIGQYKAAVTREIHKAKPGLRVWQRSYHDHIIRNQASYEKIWQYIETNPQRWNEDCFYVKQHP